MLKKLLLLSIVLIFSSLVLHAQDDVSGFVNDPAVNENANACYEGGSMEGKCNDDFDGDGVISDFEVTWAWECGWYLIRYEAGTGFMPERCLTVLPVRYANCFHNQYGSFALVDPVNTFDNTVFFNFSNYDCSGKSFPGGTSIVVTGATGPEAFANCDAIGNVVFLVKLTDIGYDTPGNYWGCVVI